MLGIGLRVGLAARPEGSTSFARGERSTGPRMSIIPSAEVMLHEGPSQAQWGDRNTNVRRYK